MVIVIVVVMVKVIVIEIVIVGDETLINYPSDHSNVVVIIIQLYGDFVRSIYFIMFRGFGFTIHTYNKYIYISKSTYTVIYLWFVIYTV